MPSTGALYLPLEIELDSSYVVLRGFSNTEPEPAVLTGRVILNLSEATNIRQISVVFSGTAKVNWRDTTTHHADHPLFYDDQLCLESGPGNAHTLKAGHHTFPFRFIIPGSLPASLRTASGSCTVDYKLKAIASRPGLSLDYKVRRAVQVLRGLQSDAMEFNQTLEIENTWPGKVMYAFTLPHKAYAAGATIPISVKFAPIAKGIAVLNLVTTIKEAVTVHSKSASYTESRDVSVMRHTFTESGAPSRIQSSASLVEHMPTHQGTPLHGLDVPAPPVASSSSEHPMLRPVHSNSYLSLASTSQTSLASSAATAEPEDEPPSAEIDIVLDVALPSTAVASNSAFPVFVSHKIKWSAFIRNADGHVSELRCALPILILHRFLAEECRLASEGTRTLLFGENGVLTHSDVPQVDLPSYEDHVLDRVASAYSVQGFQPTLWSRISTPGSSPAVSRAPSPLHSPGSAPQSAGLPGHGHSSGYFSVGHSGHGSTHGSGYTSGLGAGHAPHAGQSSYTTSSAPHTSNITHSPATGYFTPGAPGQSPSIADHRAFFDSELLASLSVPNSASNSRSTSRSNSPVHGESTNVPHANSSKFFHNIHLPKPLRPLSAFSRNTSSSSLHTMNDNLNFTGTGDGPSPVALSRALAPHALRQNSTLSHRSDHSPEDELAMITEGTDEVDFLSQVPPYDVAARGFLGGGVVPLSSRPPSI